MNNTTCIRGGTDAFDQSNRLDGHVAVVTGGNGGIGLGMARGLARAGADLAIWGRNPDKNARAAGEIEGRGLSDLPQIPDRPPRAAHIRDLRPFRASVAERTIGFSATI